MGLNARRRKELKMNNGDKPKNVLPELPQGGIQLIITMLPGGQINLNGPLHDKILCYGLLQVARDIVRDFKPQQVVVPTLVLPPNLRGGGQG